MNLNLNIKPLPPKKMDFKIGCIGAGFIMKDVQLVSYRNIGFNPIAITDKIGCLFKPRWREVWFPDAFAGTMAQLLRAVEENSEPEKPVEPII